MDRFATMLKVIGFVALVSLVGVYVSDYFWIEYRLGHASGADALGTVTYYYATTLKNGRLEIFYNQPQTEVCIYAIFPHAGYRPCWYAARSKVRTVSGLKAPPKGHGPAVYSESHTVSSWLLRKWLGVIVHPRTRAL